MNTFTVFELDDFTCDEASLYALTKLKQRYPSFRATLFTILGRCDMEKLHKLIELDWLEIAVHGNDHATERFWNNKQVESFLFYANDIGCARLFKLPWDDAPTQPFLTILLTSHYCFATRNRLHGSTTASHGILTYLDCPQSIWLHPFQLDNRIDAPMAEPFLTVSEVMRLPQAKEMGWVL